MNGVFQSAAQQFDAQVECAGGVLFGGHQAQFAVTQQQQAGSVCELQRGAGLGAAAQALARLQL